MRSFRVSVLHRWKNYWIRGVLSVAMISGFCVIIYMGPFALILVVSKRSDLIGRGGGGQTLLKHWPISAPS